MGYFKSDRPNSEMSPGRNFRSPLSRTFTIPRAEFHFLFASSAWWRSVGASSIHNNSSSAWISLMTQELCDLKIGQSTWFSNFATAHTNLYTVNSSLSRQTDALKWCWNLLHAMLCILMYYQGEISPHTYICNFQNWFCYFTTDLTK